MTLTDPIRTFLSTGRKFLALATIDPDGAPRQALIWYRMDGDDLIINSRVGRRWPTNLLRDPRVAIAIADPEDGYRWVGLTATASPITDQPTAQADIAAMARHYHAADPAKAARVIADFESQERISFRLVIESAHDHLDD